MAGAGKSIAAMIPALAGVSVPMWAIIAVLALLAVAWKENWLGIGDVLSSVIGSIGPMLGSLASALGGLLQIIAGYFTDSDEMVQAGWRRVVTSLAEALFVFDDLSRNLMVWGHNLMVSLANGIIDGAGAVWRAVEGVAEGIARYFRSFSPPKHGPLTGIQRWGTNLINTLIEGMEAADFDALDEIAGTIGEAIRRNIEGGLVDPSQYAATMSGANSLVAQMLQIIRGGGSVGEDFFSSLRPALGEWYDYIVQISQAYQQVYAQERQLELESNRLEMLREQREELERQNRLRETAFDRERGLSDASSFQFNSADMVDPLSPEGQRKIEEMRRNLSREDFQNWLSWQEEMWEARANAEDASLAAQEEAQQSVVDNIQAQLDAANAQYELYVKMYEYAVKLYNLAEEQKQLEEQAEQAGKEKLDTTGTPEAVRAFLNEIAQAVGNDQAVLDEGTLARERGGDAVGALADATEQREREENRLSELERLNRRKRAEFEMQLINATNDAERAAVKQQMDSWDAAYRQEKQRLQERVSLAREVMDAAEQMADATMAGRIGPQEQAFYEQIARLLGDQTDQIEDANQLKTEAGNLDQAAILARGQLRDEERKLRDLQALGDQKKLEFEQRILEAQGDPEKLRRIKEEQEAWEHAYKRALEAQQLRVEMARRAQQDIGDEATALREASGPEGGSIPDFGAGPGIAELSEEAIMKRLGLGGEGFSIDWNKVLGIDKVEAESVRSVKAFENVQLALRFLTDEAIPTRDKLYVIGETIKEVLGFDNWWDALAPEETRNAINGFFAGLRDDFEERFSTPFNLMWSGNWSGYLEWFKTNFSAEFSAGWQADWTLIRSWFDENFAGPFKASWERDWNAVGVFFTDNFITPFKSSWERDWNAIGAFFTDTFIAPFKSGWERDWAGMRAWYNENFAALFKAAWEGDWTGVRTWFNDQFATPFKRSWETDWGSLKTWFDTNFVAPFKNSWEADWSSLKTWFTENFLTPFRTSWETDWGSIRKVWDDFWSRVKPDWDSIVGTLGSVLGPIVEFVRLLGNIRFPSMPDWLTGGGGAGDGSHADGLFRVPFDGYRAILHAGERVLTAQEASVYNSLEVMLRGMGTIQSVANRGGDSNRTVSIGTVNVNASNPDEGREFIDRLSFLGG